MNIVITCNYIFTNAQWINAKPHVFIWTVLIDIVWKSYRVVIVKAGGGSFSIACHSHFYTWTILLDWKWTQLRKIQMFHHPPTHLSLLQSYRCKWLVINHSIVIKIKLKWMWFQCLQRYVWQGDRLKRSRSVSSSLPAGVQCEQGYTPPPPGTASQSRRCCTAASLPPQTASWCCLSSWHESACRERRLCQQPPSARLHHRLIC